MNRAYRLAAAIILLIAALAVSGCGMYREKLTRDPRLIEQAYATAADINENSGFGGRCRLLECPDDRPRAAVICFIADSSDDAYYYFSFDDKTLITEIYLSSPEYDLYGIRPGDALSASEDTLKAKGFAKSADGIREKDGASYAVYDKGYVSVTLSGDGSIVTRIKVSASDPQYVGVTY